ncbi:hypothetical protein ACQP1V_09195 [Microtetraspora malaysiensis]|uniref:DUF35 domain-containing protein n=1 Tax=Microtetraspora fusca TaxID=1997 RepID=A0ABW6VF15_MICFU
MNGEATSAPGGQRFGYIAERMPHGSGYTGRLSTYVVRDAESGADHTFMYADIVTEGFRTLHVGERVRFLVDLDEPDRARYIIRLDLPEVEDYYR